METVEKSEFAEFKKSVDEKFDTISKSIEDLAKSVKKEDDKDKPDEKEKKKGYAEEEAENKREAAKAEELANVAKTAAKEAAKEAVESVLKSLNIKPSDARPADTPPASEKKSKTAYEIAKESTWGDMNKMATQGARLEVAKAREAAGL